MDITTNSGNKYSYNKSTGEIVQGVVYNCVNWNYAPLTMFHSMPDVDYFVISVTEACNLRCTYCCYSGKYSNKRSHGSEKMSCKNIDEVYSFINSFVQKRPVRISFYGGEPLTNFEVVRYAIERGYAIWKDNVSFSVSTNGVLLTSERMEWLISNGVKLAVSIDGPKIVNDRHRVDLEGNGSFDKVRDVVSYLITNHCDYLMQDVTLMMTIVSSDDIATIAELWNEDYVLKDLKQIMISGLAPNFAVGVEMADFDNIKLQCERLLDLYVQHPDWIILEKYLMQCVQDWKERPIMEAGDSVQMPTCLPTNNKLYIDVDGQIGVCEKMSDKYRIGDIHSGIDWCKANELVRSYYEMRKDRCKSCPDVRMCYMCLARVEFTNEQWDVLCHNERVYNKVHFWLFCEMAERGLIE